MGIKQGFIVVWSLTTLTVIKACLVITLCKFNIDTTNKMLLCETKQTASNRQIQT